jgi:hypothetical protein
VIEVTGTRASLASTDTVRTADAQPPRKLHIVALMEYTNPLARAAEGTAVGGLYVKFAVRYRCSWVAARVSPAVVSTLKVVLDQGRPALPTELVRSTRKGLQALTEAGTDMLMTGIGGLVGARTLTSAPATDCQSVQAAAAPVHSALITLGRTVRRLPTERTSAALAAE